MARLDKTGGLPRIATHPTTPVHFLGGFETVTNLRGDFGSRRAKQIASAQGWHKNGETTTRFCVHDFFKLQPFQQQGWSLSNPAVKEWKEWLLRRHTPSACRLLNVTLNRIQDCVKCRCIITCCLEQIPDIVLFWSILNWWKILALGVTWLTS